MYSFRILGIRVVLGPAIVLGLLGLGLLSRLSGIFLLAWIALGIVALLAHEIGHAVAFRRFGVASSVRFFLLGGLTVPEDPAVAERLSHGRMALVALAGPAVSLAIGLASLALIIVLGQLGYSAPRGMRELVFIWLFVNIGWGAFNLLPIASLDGGQALRHLLGALLPGRVGVILGVGLNLLASPVIAILALEVGQPFVAVIAIVFGLVNPMLYAELIQAIHPSPVRPEPLPRQPAPAGRLDGEEPRV